MKILGKSLTKNSLIQFVPIFTLLVLVIVFHFQSEAFLTQRNLTNLFRQVSVNCILAFGMTVIILLGAIDLSIGSVLALGSVVAGLTQVNFGFNQSALMGSLCTIAAVIGVCVLVSAFSGSIIAKFKMPSFVVTLGVFVIARGVALILSGGSKIAPLSESYRWLGTSFVSPESSLALILLVSILACVYFAFQSGTKKWFEVVLVLAGATFLSWIFYGYQGIPIPVLLMAGAFAAIYFLLQKTTFGRSVYAIGGNPEAARLCGIPVSSIIFISFVLMGVLISFAAIIESGRMDAGDPTAGNLYELDAIAAVVIGGTSLQGGTGSVGGTLLGAFLIGTVNNGMSLMNIPTNYQMVIKGSIIILAVLMDVLSKNRK
jgi:ABC-type xylose transport system permease subunit